MKNELIDPKEQLEEIAYKQLCTQYGLQPKWLGKTFRDKNDTYTIVGLNLRSKRYPVVTTGMRNGVTTRGAWNAAYVIGLMTGDLDGARAEAAEKRLVEERKNWSMATAYGLKSAWLDQTFLFRNQPVTIIGLAPARRRYPVVGKDAHGQIKYYPSEFVVKALTPAAAA